MGQWIKTELLKDQGNEVRNVGFFVEVMRACVAENNFHDATTISAVLGSKLVNWSVIPKTVSETFAKVKSQLQVDYKDLHSPFILHFGKSHFNFLNHSNCFFENRNFLRICG